MKVIDKISSVLKRKKASPAEQKKLHKVKILDKYIIKKFLGTFIFSIMLLLAIVVMFDINEKLDAMFTAPLKETLFDYFLNFLPFFMNQFSPLFTFLSVIFFTSNMADNSEIIAILSSVISYRRLLVPYMFSAAVIATCSFILAAYIIPPSNIKVNAYTNKYVRNKSVNYGTNIQLQVEPGVIAYMARYDKLTRMGSKFSLEKFEKKKLVSRLTASNVRYDTLYNWHIDDYVIRDFDGMRETIKRGISMDTIIEMEPRDFLISQDDQETLTNAQLSEYIDRQKERGVANIKDFEIEYHKRFAMIGAAFILTVIGMSLSSRKVKGGMGFNIGVGLVLSFSYILFSTITSAFAVSGYTSALVAMWIPNVIYVMIAIYLYRRAAF